MSIENFRMASRGDHVRRAVPLFERQDPGDPVVASVYNSRAAGIQGRGAVSHDARRSRRPPRNRFSVSHLSTDETCRGGVSGSLCRNPLLQCSKPKARIGSHGRPANPRHVNAGQRIKIRYAGALLRRAAAHRRGPDLQRDGLESCAGDAPQRGGGGQRIGVVAILPADRRCR